MPIHPALFGLTQFPTTPTEVAGKEIGTSGTSGKLIGVPESLIVPAIPTKSDTPRTPTIEPPHTLAPTVFEKDSTPAPEIDVPLTPVPTSLCPKTPKLLLDPNTPEPLPSPKTPAAPLPCMPYLVPSPLIPVSP